MFAVVKTGGKQYAVTSGSVIKVEKLEGSIGNIITLDDVIFANDNNNGLVREIQQIRVKAEVLEQKKDKKIVIFKKRRRKNYRRKNGHRQQCTVLRIIGVEKYGN